ncbi:MAG TPA: hypothetical protein VMW47_02025 [Verrucomicrobiae bacterium]|nr:hypothetical protein [Verrucomicrobiae bacterium]
MKTLATRLMALALVGLGMSMASGVPAVAASTATSKVTVHISPLPRYTIIGRVYYVTATVTPSNVRERVNLDKGAATGPCWTQSGTCRLSFGPWASTEGIWRGVRAVVFTYPPLKIIATSNADSTDVVVALPKPKPTVHMTASTLRQTVGKTVVFVAHFNNPGHVTPPQWGAYNGQWIDGTVPTGWWINTPRGQLDPPGYVCQHSDICHFRVTSQTSGRVIYHAVTPLAGPMSNRITVTWLPKPKVKAGNA